MAKDSIELALSVLEAEKANLSDDQMKRLAELGDMGETVREGVTETLETTEKRELTHEQVDKLVSTLKARFETSDKKLRKAIYFADVEKSLRASSEKPYALHKLEETGGDPQVIGLDGDEFVFEDRSTESPSGRRYLNFYEADAQRKSFGQGVEFQGEDAYRDMQKNGKFDLESWSWLKTSPETREAGYAMDGDRLGDGVGVRGSGADVRLEVRGWRASLRVKKV